jgi:hypothetical protein
MPDFVNGDGIRGSLYFSRVGHAGARVMINGYI